MHLEDDKERVEPTVPGIAELAGIAKPMDGRSRTIEEMAKAIAQELTDRCESTPVVERPPL